MNQAPSPPSGTGQGQGGETASHVVSLGVAMARLTVPVLLLAFLAAPPARGAEPERESDFWPSILDPGRREFEVAMEKGLDLLDKAKRVAAEPLRSRVLQDALAAFREATRHSPNNYRGWYQSAVVLTALDRTKEAIASYRRARALGPEDREVLYRIAFELGIAYSKTGAFEKAVLEYDRADGALAGITRGRDVRGGRSTVHGNAAEALMALGRLDEAIQRYRESLSYNPGNNLVRYGLAVAYDRDEQISKAQQEMRTVLAVDPDMRELQSDNVFFIPEGDIHYYFALGRQSRGDLEEAKKQWQLFLQKLPGSQWAPRARAHLAALGVAPDGQQHRKGRLAPVPKPVGGNEQASARDRAAVRSRLSSYLYRIRGCYRTELRKQPTLAGELRLVITVRKNGRPEGVRIARSTLHRPTMQRCVVNVVKGIYFSRPVSGRPVRVEYPMKFQP